MNIAQVVGVAAAFEASRQSGAQQASAAVSSTGVQRQAGRNAAETGLRRIEVINEPDEPESATNSQRRLLDITV